MKTRAPASVEQWWEIAEIGATGQVARARRRSATLLAAPPTAPPTASLLLSTRASLTRQAGGHGLARIGDGTALALVAEILHDSQAAPRRLRDDPWASTAAADALIGLAADNLGLGDFGASWRLLGRAAEVIDAAVDDSGDWRATQRTRLRLAWVRTEWGLYSGDLAAARQHAAEGAELAGASPSPRHRLKTAFIGAAVAAAVGDVDRAAAVAAQCRDDMAALDLVPLQWAAETMLAGLRPDDGTHAVNAATLRRRLADSGMSIAPLAWGERHGR